MQKILVMESLRSTLSSFPSSIPLSIFFTAFILLLLSSVAAAFLLLPCCTRFGRLALPRSLGLHLIGETRIWSELTIRRILGLKLRRKFPRIGFNDAYIGELMICLADPESNRFLIQNKEKLLDCSHIVSLQTVQIRYYRRMGVYRQKKEGCIECGVVERVVQ